MAINYTTPESLAEYLGKLDQGGNPDPSALPVQADERMMRRASETIYKATMSATYHADDEGMPEDDAVADAFAEATNAQIESWLVSGDEHGQKAAYSSVSIGSLSLSGASAAVLGGERLAPRAHAALQRAGLLPGRPWV